MKTDRQRHRPLRYLPAAAALLIAGCAGLTPGVSKESDVLALWGKPVEQRQLANGERELDYSRQPVGFENWRVTVDASGTLRGTEQLLDEAHFARVRPGMARAEVERVLGRPAESARFPRLNELVVSWHYLEYGNVYMFFNAHFDPAGSSLRYTSRTVDPAWSATQGRNESYP